MVQGLWYEKSRDRWRVKIRFNGQLHHRSYHRNYDEALAVWTNVHQELKRCRISLTPTRPLTAIEQFLRQPPPGLA